MTAGAMTNGFGPDTRLDCSSGLRRWATGCSRTTSPAPTARSGSTGRSRSPATPSSTASATTSGRSSAPTSTTSTAKDPLVEEAMTFGFGGETGIDLPGEASGRIADRRWKRHYWKQMKDYYCGIAAKPQDADDQRLRLHVRARVLRRGLRLPRRRRGELRDRAGRHDRHSAPARARLRRAGQRRHALRAADREGDRQPRRDGAKRFRPKKVAGVGVPDSVVSATSTPPSRA